jgi:hypothetical protein
MMFMEDGNPFGYNRFEHTPPGPLEAWKDGPFVGVVKGETTILRLNQMDMDCLVASRQVLEVIMNEQLTPQEISHFKELIDTFIRTA